MKHYMIEVEYHLLWQEGWYLQSMESIAAFLYVWNMLWLPGIC